MSSKLYDNLKADLAKIVEDFNKANTDHVLTVSEIWVLVQDGIALFVNAAKEIDGTGADKKTAVMEAATLFYDDVLAALIAANVSGPFGGIVAKLGKNIYLELVSGMVDWIVKNMNGPTPTPTPEVKKEV